MKILAVQNRMGIGDTVIFLPFIKAISEKYNSPVSLLVRENSKAAEFLHHTNYINEILILERDKKLSNKHGGFFGTLNLIKELKIKILSKLDFFKSLIKFIEPKKPLCLFLLEFLPLSKIRILSI